MRFGWMLAGFALGWLAHAALAGKPTVEPRRVDFPRVTCLECRKSNWEAHGGDAQLVCWKSPATGGKVVRPSGWCSEAEGRGA